VSGTTQFHEKMNLSPRTKYWLDTLAFFSIPVGFMVFLTIWLRIPWWSWLLPFLPF
jgi:hypothetical protein